MKRSLFLTISLVPTLLFAGLLIAVLARPASALPAAVFTVNSTADSGTAIDCSDGTCELREALGAAALNPGTDTIVFDLPDNSIIMLQLGSLPAITETLTINGSDIVSLTISANNASGIFELDGDALVTMDGLILRDGNATLGSAINVTGGSLSLLNSKLISNTATYGTIYLNSGNVNVSNSSFLQNSVSDGGGIYNAYGTGTVADSIFANNNAGIGGGILNQDDGTFTVSNSTFSGNYAGGGGGIGNSGMLTITGGTFVDNTAGYAGGSINNWNGTVIVTDSTFTANHSGNSGGAIYTEQGTVLLSSSWLDSNSADLFGGAVDNNGGVLIVTDSAFFHNLAGADGGAIDTSGTFTLTNTMISSNDAGAYGGAIYNNGTGLVSYSTLTGNSAVLNGGGFYIFSGSTVTLDNSIFADNIAGDEGGGAYIDHGSVSQVTVTSSTFLRNSAGSGGGIVNNSMLTVSDSTFSSNEAGGAGGIANYESSTVSNSTFSDNSATFSGGGVVSSGATITLTNSTFSANSAGGSGAAIYSFGGGTTTMANNILANSTSGEECTVSSGALVDEGGNLVEDGSCSFPAGGNPMLGPLQDNGGATLTHALLSGSPAIDAGNDALCPTFDQRGVARPQDGDGDGEMHCDIGAYELRTEEGPYLTDVDIISPIDEGAGTTLSVTVIDEEPGDILTLHVDWGDGTETMLMLTAPATFELEHFYTDNGTYTVEVAVLDDVGPSDVESLAIVVNNVAPSVDAGPDQILSLGESALLAASFLDPGADSYMASINWGDGVVEQGTVSGNSIDGSHEYLATGVFTVTVIVEDDDLGTGADTFLVTVIEPEAQNYFYLPFIQRD